MARVPERTHTEYMKQPRWVGAAGSAEMSLHFHLLYIIVLCVLYRKAATA